VNNNVGPILSSRICQLNCRSCNIYAVEPKASCLNSDEQSAHFNTTSLSLNDTMGSIEKEQTLVKLPVIDFAKWDSASTPEQRLAVAKELADACHNVGFVFIINHGVSPELLDEAFGWSKRLFDLKTEEKMLAPHPDGPTVHRGYSWPGLEKVSQVISEDLEVGEKLRAVTDCKVNVPGLNDVGYSDERCVAGEL
jgi:hypothetical protein